MINYIISLVFVFSIFGSSNQHDNHANQKPSFQADLQNISYYSKCECPVEKPILVRVKYSVKNSDNNTLKMKHLYDGGITSRMPVTEFDKDGSIIFVFCMSENESKRFTTIFTDAEGAESNPVPVFAHATSDKVINGTAPQSIKK